MTEWRVANSLGDIMTSQVVTVETGSALTQARDLMRKRGISHLPVTSKGTVVGVLSRRDLWAFGGKDAGIELPDQVTVDRAMSSPATTLDPRSTVAWATALLQMHSIGCIPVVENGRLVGIITETDLNDAAAGRQP